MKANAPEILYVDASDKLSDSILYGFTEKRKEDDIEYIRKDAFIENICEWLKEHVLEYVPEMNYGVGKTQPDYYTKNFIESLKKYMNRL